VFLVMGNWASCMGNIMFACYDMHISVNTGWATKSSPIQMIMAGELKLPLGNFILICVCLLTACLGGLIGDVIRKEVPLLQGSKL